MKLGDRRRTWSVVIAVVVVVAIVAGGLGILGGARGGSSHSSSSTGAPGALTVNGSVSPVGVDPDRVAFAWHVGDTRPMRTETAYRVVVSRDARPAARGRRASFGTIRSTRGSRPSSRTAARSWRPTPQYWWTVQTTTVERTAGTRRPRSASFAASQPFVTGLRESDWKAQWVRPGPVDHGAEEYTYLRKETHLTSSPIVRATAYVAAQHQYQLYVNGDEGRGRPLVSPIPTSRTTRRPT